MNIHDPAIETQEEVIKPSQAEAEAADDVGGVVVDDDDALLFALVLLLMEGSSVAIDVMPMEMGVLELVG